jgi:hypothetical protein
MKATAVAIAFGLALTHFAAAQDAVQDPDPQPLTDKKYKWEDFLTDSASGAVTAAGMLGLSGENVTSVENVRALVFALPALGSSDSDQTIGLSITPARTGFAPMNLQSYANSFAMRLLGSLTLGYARGPTTIENVDFDRSAFSIDTNAFFRREDDVIVAYAAGFAKCGVLQQAAPSGPPTSAAPIAPAAPGTPATPGAVSSEESGPQTPGAASPAEAAAIRARADKCRGIITTQVNSRWNRSQLSISYGEAEIRIKDHTKPRESFGRTLAISAIYGFGNSVESSRGYALVVNYRRTEKEPILTTLALPQSVFKDSSLFVARLSGGNDRSRIFAEFSDVGSHDITASQRAFKSALGIDVRAFEGTWLNFRVGKQRRIDGTDTETGSLLSITYSPKALL